jgi:hypothetical protein
MRGWREKVPHATHVAYDVASAAWLRFLRGPVGSIGFVRWVGAWIAYVFLALLLVATLLRDRPNQATLWWLVLLALISGSIASVARDHKRHDPGAWVVAVLVFLIGGMAVQPAWHKVGLMLLIAVATYSQSVEWAVILVQRVGNWATTALMWLSAWALLTNMGLAALEPATRAVNPRGSGVIVSGISVVTTVVSAGAALLMLLFLLRGYLRLCERREVAM